LVDDGLPRNYVGREEEGEEEEEGEGATAVVVDNAIRHDAIRKVNGDYVI